MKKSLALLMFLTSVVAHADVDYSRLFQCQTKVEKPDAAPSEAAATFKTFISKTVVPNLAINLTLDADSFFDFDTFGGFSAQIDAHALANFTDTVNYPLTSGVTSGINMADKNSQIDIHIMSNPKVTSTNLVAVKNADDANNQIIQKISALVTVTPTKIPNAAVEITFKEANSPLTKYMRLKLEGLNTGKKLTSVELRSISGTATTINVQGLNVVVFSFHGNLGTSKSINYSSDNVKYFDSVLDMNGIYVPADKTGKNPKSVASLKQIESKICTGAMAELKILK